MRPLSQPECHAERIWVGPTPRTWPHVRVKHLAQLYAGGTPDRENRDYWDDGTIPWLNSGAVNQWLITEASEYITEEGFRNSSAKWIPKGALVMALAGQGKTKGMVAELAIDSTCNQSMAAIVPLERVHPRFLLYWLHANYESIRNRAGGEQRDGLNLEIIGEIPCFLPDLRQQCTIVDYLDRATARLDTLIAAKERVLHLLAEKRRALITRIVTRGLDPRAPLRDSGIPCLGKVPAHWKVTRLKFVAHVQTGLALGKEFSGGELHEYPYLRVANVQDGFLDLAEVKKVAVPEAEAALCRLSSGDVLMNEGGDADKLGRGAIWTGKIEPCLHQNHVFAVRPHSVTSEWLASWTLSDVAKAYFESRSKQSTNLASISSTNLMEMPLLMPGDDDQRAILEYIRSRLETLDKVHGDVERTVKLLKERRSALIAAAVTGRLNVHGDQFEYIRV